MIGKPSSPVRREAARKRDQPRLAPRRAADPSAWLTAHRRLARDYERHPAVSEAMIRWAAINTITRRIARGSPAVRQQRRTLTAIS
jgi:hypothetical protein